MVDTSRFLVDVFPLFPAIISGTIQLIQTAGKTAKENKMLNPKYFQNQNDVPDWWTEQDDKDVENALSEKPLVFGPYTEPIEDESELDNLYED